MGHPIRLAVEISNGLTGELAQFIAGMTCHGSMEIWSWFYKVNVTALRLSSVRLVWFKSGSGAGF